MVESDKDYERILDAWCDVPRIAYGRVIPSDRETLLEFVEEPLGEAVGALYDKNIQTLGSSCNKFDRERGFAYISINRATLSAANRAVVDNYPHQQVTLMQGTDIEMIGLFFPIGDMETPNDIGRRATLLAEQFELQPLNWITTAKLEDVVRYFTEGDGASLSVEEVIQKLTDDGFYFDSESRTFFPSEELFQKYKEAPQAAG